MATATLPNPTDHAVALIPSLKHSEFGTTVAASLQRMIIATGSALRIVLVVVHEGYHDRPTLNIPTDNADKRTKRDNE